jgi:hypothetical protein
LAFKFNHNSNSFPFSSFLDNIFTDFLGIETERTELRGKGGSGTWLTSENFNVDCNYG